MYRRLKDLREDNDFTQEQIAVFLDYSHSAYAKIERGERSLTAGILVKLSFFYDVSTDYILGLTDNPYRIKRLK
ncbi:helix-turn-helix domain-containing protein [Streptococcus sp. Marseille-Q7156]|jgi:cro/CI family transcriptional regulator